jgi:hypothetical protein
MDGGSIQGTGAIVAIGPLFADDPVGLCNTACAFRQIVGGMAGGDCRLLGFVPLLWRETVMPLWVTTQPSWFGRRKHLPFHGGLFQSTLM